MLFFFFLGFVRIGLIFQSLSGLILFIPNCYNSIRHAKALHVSLKQRALPITALGRLISVLTKHGGSRCIRKGVTVVKLILVATWHRRREESLFTGTVHTQSMSN